MINGAIHLCAVGEYWSVEILKLPMRKRLEVRYVQLFRLRRKVCPKTHKSDSPRMHPADFMRRILESHQRSGHDATPCKKSLIKHHV
uniref:Uncharacterized protein n=1 Tax=Anopheles coluzzii TaxID=1518534 RepID=A0A9I3BDA8_ANOCL